MGGLAVRIVSEERRSRGGDTKRNYIRCASLVTDQHIWQLFGEDISSPMIGRTSSAAYLSQPHAATAWAERMGKDLKTNMRLPTVRHCCLLGPIDQAKYVPLMHS